MRSKAVEEGLKSVYASIGAARSTRMITGPDASDLRAQIDDAVQWHSLGGGQLRAYARELAGIARVPASKVRAGDRVFNTTPFASYRRWRLVESAEREDELVKLSYKDGYHETFGPTVKIVRVPRSTEVESALHDLVKG